MSFMGEMRRAERGLRRSAGFAAACAVTLALGTWDDDGDFQRSVWNSVARTNSTHNWPAFPYGWKSVPKKNLERDWTSYPTYEDWKRESQGFEEMAAFLRPDWSVVNLSEGDREEQIQSTKVSGNFFSVLGTSAFLKPDKVVHGFREFRIGSHLMLNSELNSLSRAAPIET